MAEARWPALPYGEWEDTYATLHMWSQIVGKIALASAPPLNHCWGSAMRLTARGLTTALLAHGERTFSIEFDFVDHRLLVDIIDGSVRTLPLAPRSVADFYAMLMDLLRAEGLATKIWPVAVEVPTPVRFTDDVEHRSYDAAYANRFWRILIEVERVFTASRCRFVGKTSPVNFFWGSFDLALTRFSGRPAPPRDGPAFMKDAYSHEVISHGFWPGSGPITEAAFYAYAVPEPSGLKDVKVQPDGAYYHRELGEFILPYDAVRASTSPEQTLLAFIESTYDRAATLGKWDRSVLEWKRAG